MRNNRVLSTAIATALSLGVSTSYAGKLIITHGTGDNKIEGPPTFASEYFLNNPSESVPDGGEGGGADDLGNAGGTTPGRGGPATDAATVIKDDPLTHGGTYGDNYIYAIYNTETPIKGTDFLARFTLKGGTFGDKIDLNTADVNKLDFVANPSGTHVAAMFFGAGGNKGDDKVTFLIQNSATEWGIEDQVLFLRFTLGKLDGLSKPGGNVEMTVQILVPGASDPPEAKDIKDNLASDHDPDAVVAKSKRGASVKLIAANDPVLIDVGVQGGVEFTGDPISASMAKLGSVEIKSNAGVLKQDMTEWKFVDDPPASGKLTITKGNFAASVDGSGGRVFLDVNKDNAYDGSSTPPDILATVKADEPGAAEFNFTTEDLTELAQAITVPIIIEADGTTPINAFRDPPQGTLKLEYGGGLSDTIGGKLAHIKRNGKICSLYNIPNPNATDEGNIRVTNTSSKAGKLLGTLRALDGTEIFTNEDLLALLPAPLTELQPNATVRLTETMLDTAPKKPAWLAKWTVDPRNPTGGNSGWPGRAVLTISATMPNMEVFGLVRNRLGGPLTNMSVGGTGNGCEE